MIDLDTLRAALSSPDERTRALAARSVCPCQAGFDLFLELEPELHFLAVVRAGFDRPATPDGLADIDRRVADELMADGVMPSGRLNDYLRARTRFIDQQVATALAGNVRQIVIVGAGYDFRAWRFRDRGVRFFEIDHPATQADKLRLLQRVGVDALDVTFIPADLGASDIGSALTAAGHSVAELSLFVCEGLLIYLDRSVNEMVLRALRRQAAPGSRLVLTRPTDTSSEERAARRAQFHTWLARIGEPPRTHLSELQWQQLLEACGWRPEPGRAGSPLVTATSVECDAV